MINMSFIHSFYLSDISDANLAGLLSSPHLKLSGLPLISSVMQQREAALTYVSPKDAPSATAEQENNQTGSIFNTLFNYLASQIFTKNRQGLSKGRPAI